MQIVALSILFLSILTLAACQSKAAKVKQLQDQYNADHSAFAMDCLEEDYSEATRLLTGQNLSKEQTADLGAKRKKNATHGASQGADRLAQLQKRNSCRTAIALQEHH